MLRDDVIGMFLFTFFARGIMGKLVAKVAEAGILRVASCGRN